MSCVNKQWNLFVLDERRNELSKTLFFLTENLVAEGLSAKIKEKLSPYIPLVEQKKFKEEAIQLLSYLSDEELHSLQVFADEQGNKHALNLLHLVSVYKELPKPGTPMDDRNLRKHVQALALYGDFQKAEQILNLIADERIRDWARIDFSNELGKQECFAGARKIIESIDFEGNKDRAYRELSSNLTKCGRFDQSLELAEKMKNNGRYVSTLKEIVKELEERKMVTQAKEVESRLLEFMVTLTYRDLELAEKMKNKGHYVSTLKEIMEEFKERKMFAQAKEIESKLREHMETLTYLDIDFREAY